MDLCYALGKPSIAPSSALLLIPPKKLTKAYYRCDNKFHLDSILEMFEEGEKIGVCLISGKELLIYIISTSGEHIDYHLTKKIDIFLANKHNKGGQSSNRFGRIVKIVRNNYVDIIVENIINAYMYDNNTKCIISNIILAGPGEMKNDVANTNEFKQYFSKYLHKIITTDTPNEGTIYELTTEICNGINNKNVKSVENEINNLVQTNYDNLAFGIMECTELIKNKNIKKIFINVNSISSEMKDSLQNDINGEIIFTNCHTLTIYGDWIAIKKY